MVNVETENGKFLMSKDNAIELALNEYFENRQVKIDNQIFDVMNYGNYEMKAVMQ